MREVTAKAGCQLTSMWVILMRFSLSNVWNLYPYSYSGFYGPGAVPAWDNEQRLGASALRLHLTGDVSLLGRRRHTSMDK